MLGAINLRAGNAAEAVKLLTLAIDCGEKHDLELFRALGIASLMAGEYSTAERTLNNALAMGLDDSNLRMNLGMALAGLDRTEQAKDMLRQAQQLDPSNYEAGINLGNVLAQCGSVDAALEQYFEVLKASPIHPNALFNVATLYRQTGRYEEAINYYRRLLDISNNHLEAMINLGTIYEHLGNTPEAMLLYEKVLAKEPSNLTALINLSSVFINQFRYSEAAELCNQVLKISPNHKDAWVNLGSIYAITGEFVAAKKAYLKALQIDPNDNEVRVWSGMLGLAQGDFREKTWLYYQARSSRLEKQRGLSALDDQIPEKCTGLTIMIIGEQGIGDELFFLRYADLLKAKGVKLSCVCDPKISSLVERSGVCNSVYEHGTQLPLCDKSIVSGDLPLVVGRISQNYDPVSMPLKLKALQKSLDIMQRYLADGGAPPYLALTWRGGIRREDQSVLKARSLYKEIPLEALVSGIRGFNGTIISLQRNPKNNETTHLSELLGRPVLDAAFLNNDLEQMLALLQLIDEYVGVSNANMHLLAGLGGRARVLVPNPAEWRWMADGKTSPWFPGFITYRQQKDGSWGEAMAQLRDDLSSP